MYTHMDGLPMEEDRFEPFYAKMTELDRLVQVHPCRNADWPDYPTEERSRYEIWWTFGWEYDLSAWGYLLVSIDWPYGPFTQAPARGIPPLTWPIFRIGSEGWREPHINGETRTCAQSPGNGPGQSAGRSPRWTPYQAVCRDIRSLAEVLR